MGKGIDNWGDYLVVEMGARGEKRKREREELDILDIFLSLGGVVLPLFLPWGFKTKEIVELNRGGIYCKFRICAK